MKKAFILLSLIANITFAQDTAKFFSSYQLAGSISGGNSNRQLFSTSETFVYTKGKTTLSTNPSFVYGTTGNNNKVAETEYFQTLSYNYHLSEKSKLMIFSDIDHSNLRSIYLRTSFGEGYLYKILDKKNLRLDVSEAFMMEKTQTLKDSLALNLFSARLSTRVRLNLKIRDNVHISLISLIQPSIAQFFINDVNKNISPKDNFLSRSTFLVEFSLFKNLTFVTNISYIVETYSNYLTKENIKLLRPLPVDYNIQFGLKYKTK